MERTELNLQELKRLSERAAHIRHLYAGGEVSEEALLEAMRRFNAAANPAAILELLAQLEAREAEIADLREDLSAARCGWEAGAEALRDQDAEIAALRASRAAKDIRALKTQPAAPEVADCMPTDAEDLRMDAYYFGFERTGNKMIDRILSAVACAGKAYHNTDQWQDDTRPYEPCFRGRCPVDWIQNAANDAAAVIKSPADVPLTHGDLEHFIQNECDRAPEPLRRLGDYLSKVLDEDEWKTAERMLLGAIVHTPAAGNQEAALTSQTAKDAIPVAAYDRLNALNESNAARILELEEQIALLSNGSGKDAEDAAISAAMSEGNKHGVNSVVAARIVAAYLNATKRGE